MLTFLMLMFRMLRKIIKTRPTRILRSFENASAAGRQLPQLPAELVAKDVAVPVVVDEHEAGVRKGDRGRVKKSFLICQKIQTRSKSLFCGFCITSFGPILLFQRGRYIHSDTFLQV
jgi:hypothetical protein